MSYEIDTSTGLAGEIREFIATLRDNPFKNPMRLVTARSPGKTNSMPYGRQSGKTWLQMGMEDVWWYALQTHRRRMRGTYVHGCKGRAKRRHALTKNLLFR